jgi:pectate lyase
MVQTATELEEALQASGPSVIEISGTIDLGGDRLDVPSDTTVLGVGGAEILGSIRLDIARNVIVENIKFNGASASGDAVEVSASTCVWFDHCEFVDGADGNLDIVRGSDLVTVSWSRFYYVERTDTHRFGSLCGHDDDPEGTLDVTLHHNWWGDGVLEMMPRTVGGRLHIFNNYYSASDNVYCIGAGYMSKLLVQNNFFDGVNDPIVFRSDEDASGAHTAEILEMGNDYGSAVGEHVSRGTAFDPPYVYSLEPAQAARDAVVAMAGAR